MHSNDQLYGISTWIFEEKGLKIEEALNKISASGFKCVEIWGNLFHLDPRINPDIKSIKALVNKLDLCVHSIHAPFTGLKIGYPDIRLEKEWLRVIGASLEYCVKLGAEIAVVHSYSCSEKMDKEMSTDSREFIKEFIEKLNKFALELGIQLAVENQPSFNTPPFIHSIKELSRLWPDNEIGFCFDIGHASLNRVETESEIAAAEGRLISVHVSNNDGISDLHALPVKGVLDWERIKLQLGKHGYNGPYILEVRGGKNPDIVLNQLQIYIQQ